MKDKSKSWASRFIKEFCNDHNGEVRFLRSVFYDEKDGAEEIMSFIAKEIQSARAEAVEEERARVADILTNELDVENMLEGWEVHWKKAPNGKYIERCIECINWIKIDRLLKEYEEKKPLSPKEEVE